MADAVPREASVPERYTVERYFGLVDEGLLAPDDPVELLAGVIVAMSPQNAPHAAAVCRTGDALRTAVGTRAAVREEKPLVLGTHSVPEPVWRSAAPRTGPRGGTASSMSPGRASASISSRSLGPA